MKKSPLTLEHALYALALVIALGVRFINLGALQLSDFEAGWALQALHIAQGLRPALDPNPAYLHLTAVLFFIFGATDFLARFWPALAGTALVIAPYIFRHRLGRLPALVLAFGLALDPGLSALSRLAGGSMLALVFVVLAWAMWEQGRQALAGVLAGLALLSGPSVWFGLLGLLLAWALSLGLAELKPPEAADKKPAGKKAAVSRARPKPVAKETVAVRPRFQWKKFQEPLAWGLGTLLVVGSLLLISPQGLAAFVASLPAFLRGWLMLSDVSGGQALLALPVYELMPLIFGLVAAVRGVLKRDMLSIRLGAWFLAALILVLVYPSKQVADLSWALIPLWTLAALELGCHFDLEGRNLWELSGVITVVVVLLVFGWLNVAAVTNMDLVGDKNAQLRLLMALGVLLLVGLCLLLVGASWSADLARLGGVWGGVPVLVAYTIAMTTGTTGLRQPLTAELWLPAPRTAGADLLLKTADQISDLNRGYIASLPVTIVGLDSPALNWSLRSWQVQAVDALSPTDNPPLFVTPAGAQFSLTASYRGEGFAWRETFNLDKSTPPGDWLRWLVYHQLPVKHDEIVLWVRSDLAVDSQNQPLPPNP